MRTGKCVLAACAAILLAGAMSRAGAVCGDGVRDGSEQCDGADLGGQTCADVTSGFVHGGTLACNADCTFNTDGCRQAFIQSLVPARGGAVKNRCQLEWTVVGAHAAGAKLSCSDGDGGCDQDRSFDGTCTMELQLCLNVPDPKVPGCAFMTDGSGKVFDFAVLQPQALPDVVQAVLGAATGLARGANVSASQGASDVSFSPPVTSFACGQATVKVPLRGTTGHARPGKVKLRARSSDNSGKIKAIGQLTLICMP